MNDRIHQKVKLNYTPDTLPAKIAERFEPGWTAIQICEAVGFIDDDSDGFFVLFEDGPGPRSGVLLQDTDVRSATQAEIAAASEMALAEAPAPSKRAADFVTKVYLVGRKNPVLVSASAGDVVSGCTAQPNYWPEFNLVGQDGMLTGEPVTINPKNVVSVVPDYNL